MNKLITSEEANVLIAMIAGFLKTVSEVNIEFGLVLTGDDGTDNGVKVCISQLLADTQNPENLKKALEAAALALKYAIEHDQRLNNKETH